LSNPLEREKYDNLCNSPPPPEPPRTTSRPPEPDPKIQYYWEELRRARERQAAQERERQAKEEQNRAWEWQAEQERERQAKAEQNRAQKTEPKKAAERPRQKGCSYAFGRLFLLVANIFILAIYPHVPEAQNFVRWLWDIISAPFACILEKIQSFFY
jgi:Flp pilus assembly protein TadB